MLLPVVVPAETLPAPLPWLVVAVTLLFFDNFLVVFCCCCYCSPCNLDKALVGTTDFDWDTKLSLLISL